MGDENQQRALVLESIRRSLGQSNPESSIAVEYGAIPRTYKSVGTLGQTALLDLFQDRLHEYDAGIYRTSAGSIPDKIAELLIKRGKRGLVIPKGIPVAWLPAGFAFTDASESDAYQLDAAEGILTGCTVAIAETGSIVLQNAPAQGPRRLSLVPDYHLCVVFADQVVETVPESFDRLKATAELPTTFISGPSATADIEMTRIKGVHGPRFLDVLIVID